MHSYRPINTLAWCCIGLLIGSGILHVPVYLFDDLPWEDARSFRKPILFGISTGVTLWSCLWALGRLPRWKSDSILRDTLSVSLLVEVALITMQPWRSVASHFNESTPMDRGVEMAMLVLIVIASVVILVISLRAWIPSKVIVDSDRTDFSLQVKKLYDLAIRYGLLFLVVSCLIGFMISAIGKWNLMHRKPPELYGMSGVLKFPHGATLHAIQSLAFLAWLGSTWLKRGHLVRSMGLAILAHFLWLSYSIYQTVNGWSREPSDAVGYGLIAGTLLSTFLCGISLIIPRKPAPQR